MDSERKNRSLVIRNDATRTLFLTLLSFAVSVTLTRVFLHLTNYPKLGSGYLHIAHVLWGGLFMFIAIIFLILYSNRWVRSLAGALSGVGVGLFIDEVGKFITMSNDYFAPAAAPIIYAFFLLTILVYLVVRRTPRDNVRALSYEVIDQLKELLDNDLSNVEAASIYRKLEIIKESKDNHELAMMSQHLLNFFNEKDVKLPQHRLSWYEKIEFFFQEQVFVILTRKRMAFILVLGLMGWGIWSLYFPMTLFLNRNNLEQIRFIIEEFLSKRMLYTTAPQFLLNLRIGFAAALGMLMIISSILLALRKDKIATQLAFWALLISLTISNLLLFYFDQFVTILYASIEFLLIIMILSYQKRYLGENARTIK